MNRLLALFVLLCLIVGPPRASSLLRAADAGSPTEQEEDSNEDAGPSGKEAEGAIGGEAALARRVFSHPALRASGPIADALGAGPLPAFAGTDPPHLRPPRSRLPRRQI